MKKINKLVFEIFVLMSLVLNLTIIPALQIKDIETHSLNKGDSLYFSYKLFSEEDTDVFLKEGVECAFVNITPNFENVSLKSNTELVRLYNPGFIIMDLESQECTAYIEILSPIKKEESKNFSIGSKPAFSFKIVLNKKIFILDEKVNITYESDIKDPDINAILVYPDKSIKDITLPTSIKCSQIGIYQIEVTASKKDYETISVYEQFGVIEKDAEIKALAADSGVENIDNIDIQDKKSEEAIEKVRKNDKLNAFFIYSVIFLIIMVFILLLIFLKKIFLKNPL